MKQNPFKDLTIQGKEDVYIQLFSLGTNTNCSLSEKLELLYLICFLSYKMREKDPIKFKKTINVLQHLYNKEFINNGEDNYLITLSIICDDLLFGVTDIEKPKGFTNASEICTRIKDLVDQWMPF